MIRFNPRIGAAVLVGLAATYLVLSLVTHRSAASERPVDLSASDKGLDVWRAAALLVREHGHVALVDVRPKERFDLYHIPGATNLPTSHLGDVIQASAGKSHILVVAEGDKESTALLQERAPTGVMVHFLKDGARSWYLAFELPVAMFSDKPTPFGYESALQTTRKWFASHQGDPGNVLEAISLLARSSYEPTLLRGKKPAGAAGPKKITGGCGG